MTKFKLFVYPVVAAISLLSAGLALADDPTVDNTAKLQFTSPKTRAQVLAELAQAQAAGATKVWSINYNPLRTALSTKTRQEVRAELVGAHDLGAMYAEDSGSFALARVPNVRQVTPIYAAVGATQR